MKINIKHSYSQALPPTPLPVVTLHPLARSDGNDWRQAATAPLAYPTPIPAQPSLPSFGPAPGSPPIVPAAPGPLMAPSSPVPRPAAAAPAPQAALPAPVDPAPGLAPNAATAMPQGNTAGPGQVNVLNLLADLSTTLPMGQLGGLSRISQARDIARQLRAPRPVNTLAQSRATNPADLSLGVVQALRRNMPAAAPSLTRFEQMARTMKTMNSLVGNLAPTMNSLLRGDNQDMGALSNGSRNPTLPPLTAKNPSAGINLGDTLGNLLSNMDEDKKRQLAQMAQRLVGEFK